MKDSATRFDKLLTSQKRMPEEVKASAILFADTLDLCWAAAQAVFEKQAKPEHAIAMLPWVMQRADDERRLEEARLLSNTGAEATPTAKKRRPRRGGPMAA